jgi:hypothetical protein
MAYTKTIWAERQGTNLTRFTKAAETPTSVNLTPAPTITKAGTPFSAENMNKIEQGIYEAHQGITGISDTLTARADMVDGMSRNLLDVLGVSTIPDAMAALRVRCNETGTPNFLGLMIGDYLDGINLSAIPAENGGDAGQAWNNTYKNNRIVLSGFNTYKGSGNNPVATKNHLLFTFRNIPLRKRMNPTNTCIGGYPASELRAFLEGLNGDGTGSMEGVTTAAFLNALKAQIGNYILPVNRTLSLRPASGVDLNWRTSSLFLPTEHELLGGSAWGDPAYDDGLKAPFPIYQKALTYRDKRYNGGRCAHWECSPHFSNAGRFCLAGYTGGIGTANASETIGVSPVFCVA